MVLASVDAGKQRGNVDKSVKNGFMIDKVCDEMILFDDFFIADDAGGFEGDEAVLLWEWL